MTATIRPGGPTAQTPAAPPSPEPAYDRGPSLWWVGVFGWIAALIITVNKLATHRRYSLTRYWVVACAPLAVLLGLALLLGAVAGGGSPSSYTGTGLGQTHTTAPVLSQPVASPSTKWVPPDDSAPLTGVHVPTATDDYASVLAYTQYALPRAACFGSHGGQQIIDKTWNQQAVPVALKHGALSYTYASYSAAIASPAKATQLCKLLTPSGHATKVKQTAHQLIVRSTPIDINTGKALPDGTDRGDTYTVVFDNVGGLWLVNSIH
jgi:hypothetical protein